MVLHGESSYGTVRAGSGESVPSQPVNPDVQALNELKTGYSPSVHNEYLHMKPEEIPALFGVTDFYSDKLELLTDDKLTAPHGCWTKLGDRAQGWGIRGTYERFHGWKRTFVYKADESSEGNRNWVMTVHAFIGSDNYVKPVYKCSVFEDKDNYNPRPSCIPLASSFTDISRKEPEPLPVDPAQVESRAKELEAIASDPNFFSILERQDYNPYGLPPSSGIASDTNRNLRADVWNEKFTRMKARSPGGKEYTWSICNHCGMVYKGSTTTKTLGAHKCGCGCKLASSS
ncbi:hypothetical protein ACP70R_032378 [Stipagrostis hirtigluma subsp. patula]